MKRRYLLAIALVLFAIVLMLDNAYVSNSLGSPQGYFWIPDVLDWQHLHHEHLEVLLLVLALAVAIPVKRAKRWGVAG